MRSHYCGALDASHIGTSVSLCGWVARRREHGASLAFVDLRDRTGVVQCVVDGSVDVRNEYVLRVTGTVTRRPDGNENPEIPTGEVELTDCHVEVLSAAEPPPIPLSDRIDVEENQRLRFRYLDLRRLVLRVAAVAAAVQAAVDGGRHGPLLPDRPLPT
jgi:aspartyl-tRNA synthetase